MNDTRGDSSIDAARAGLLGLLPTILLLLTTAVAGPSLGALSRPLFALGCVAVAWFAWKRGVGVHLQSALVLFAFTPFVRRLVDLSAGYDEVGLMLTGPLLAVAVSATHLRKMAWDSRSLGFQVVPLVLVGAGIFYAISLTMFQNEWVKAATAAIKWIVPLLYAAVMLDHDDPDEVVQAAKSAFVVILPVTGIYGIWQYIDPPEWDRYWMGFANVTAGEPIAFGVRTFSTMNGPASFATFTAAGLVLVLVLCSNMAALLLAGPAAVALLLSSYRTAWLSLMIGMLFCVLHPAVRRRAATLGVIFFAAVTVIVVATPFADAVIDRLATFGEGSSDGSAQERLAQFVTLWSKPDSLLFGIGFTTDSQLSAGTMPIDGMIISCWVSMGIVVGIVCLSGYVLAGVTAAMAGWRSTHRETAVIGALACGSLIQLPFANVGSGELGFLFWTFAALGLRMSEIRLPEPQPAPDADRS
jgi:hypothetical protein